MGGGGEPLKGALLLSWRHFGEREEAAKNKTAKRVRVREGLPWEGPLAVRSQPL